MKHSDTFKQEMMVLAMKYEDLAEHCLRMAKLFPEDGYNKRAVEYFLQAERITSDAECGAFDRVPEIDETECPECGERIGRNGYFCSGCYDHCKAVDTARRVDEWLEANDKMKKLKAKLLTWDCRDTIHTLLMEALQGCFTATCGEFEINLTKERAVVTMVFDAEDIT